MAGQAEFKLEALDELTSSHARVFDAVDSLSLAGLKRELIPKLVVIGDQNIGKSSVLEAISQIPFPVRNELCTRFPIEVVQQKSEDKYITLSIPTKTGFSRKIAIHDKAELSKAIREASNWILGDSRGMDKPWGFSGHALRITISEPKRYPLTLVDLPGLFQSETATQDAKGRAEVNNIVRSYMKEQRNALLLVISAGVPYATQSAPELFKAEGDPKGERTLGIITSLDKNDSPKDILSLFDSKTKQPWQPRRGWHCLRNVNEEERQNGENRDVIEKAYFNKEWHEIEEVNKGIDNLRPKLSRFLARQIRMYLPDLIIEVRGELARLEEELKKLNTKRVTEQSQRDFLSMKAAEFQRLALNAVNGYYGETPASDYSQAFFNVENESEWESQDKRLQATVRAMTRIFSEIMRERGKKTDVLHYQDSSQSSSSDSHSSIPSLRTTRPDSISEERNATIDEESPVERQARIPKDEDAINTKESQPTVGDNQSDLPKSVREDEDWSFGQNQAEMEDIKLSMFHILRPEVIQEYESFPPSAECSFADFELKVEYMARQWRGVEDPRAVNPVMVSRLFRDETSRWRGMATRHVNLVWEAVSRFVDLALSHCVESSILNELRRLVLNDHLDKLRKMVDEKLEELLQCHDGMNPGFYDTMDYSSVFRTNTNSMGESITEAVFSAISGDFRKESISKVCNVVWKHGVQRLASKEHVKELLMGNIPYLSMLGLLGAKGRDKVGSIYEKDLQKVAARRAIETLDNYYEVSPIPNIDKI